jgi:hypothetical protein
MRWIPVSAVCLLLCSCMHFGTPRSMRPPNDNTKVLAVMDSIGDELGEFKATGRIVDYESRQSGLGYSKRFETLRAPVFIDVYAFNMRMADLPDGIDSAAFAKIYSANVDDIKVFYKGGVQDVREENVSFGGVEFKRARFFIVGDAHETGGLESSLFLAVHRGAIVKVRASYIPLGISKDADKLIDGFMRVLAAGITKSAKAAPVEVAQ